MASVHDVSGRLVRTLADGTFESGPHTLRWDGSAENGQRVTSGVYFLRYRSPDGEGAMRLILTR
jgi:flagellar hook assembly protein FlgD